MSPFFHYNSSFDAQAIMHRHAAPGLLPNPKYLTNFLGVLIDPKFFPDVLNGRTGEVEPVPIPANWHADIAEWAGALRAVELSGKEFTIIELGCGWGCWLNNTGVAARRAGRSVQLVGVEGHVGHIQFARESCATNGFKSSELTLIHGIAAGKNGIALFPRQSAAGTHWGLEPVLNASYRQRKEARSSLKYEEIPMVSLDTVANVKQRIDLLHIDIQGGEATLIEDCMPLLNSKVSYIVVGTHSRQIEGRIFDSMLSAGWVLEIERPAIYSLQDGNPQPLLTVDGVQGWRNPRLLPLN